LDLEEEQLFNIIDENGDGKLSLALKSSGLCLILAALSGQRSAFSATLNIMTQENTRKHTRRL
jgi:hypothetical protein